MMDTEFARLARPGKSPREMTREERQEWHQHRVAAIKARPPAITLQTLSDKIDALAAEVAALKAALKTK